MAKRICSVDDCSRPSGTSHGWCLMHYKRWKRRGDPSVVLDPGGNVKGSPRPVCVMAGCKRPSKTRGWCPLHYARWSKHGDPTVALLDRTPRSRTCGVEGCGRPRKAKTYCEMHWRRLQARGDLGDMQSRKMRSVTADGYVIHGPGSVNLNGYRVRIVPGHPNASARGDIPEHRLVMATHLGRALYDDESVHHKNGVRADNRIENLELRVRYHGAGQAVTDRVADAITILERYAPDMLIDAPVQLRVVA